MAYFRTSAQNIGARVQNNGPRAQSVLLERKMLQPQPPSNAIGLLSRNLKK